MKKIFTLFLLLITLPIFAQDTFSIVAIDSVTGEIGSAGASCVGSSPTYPHGAAILSDVIPGIGAIHTQAAWLAGNQQNAHEWMLQGLSPQQIIDSLIANDAGNNPTTRQYGIVDYNGGHPRSAAYTGVNCLNYKNDTARLNYSIQGNILLGQEILDSMQSRFLNTPGTLADRLMAALQGAKVIGADTRCADNGTSSQSAFLRVAQMSNQPDSLYLDLWMAYPSGLTGTYPVDPIDSLQTLYDQWKLLSSSKDKPPARKPVVKVFTDANGITTFDFTKLTSYAEMRLEIFDLTGRMIRSLNINERKEKICFDQKGMMLFRVTDSEGKTVVTGKF